MAEDLGDLKATPWGTGGAGLAAGGWMGRSPGVALQGDAR